MLTQGMEKDSDREALERAARRLADSRHLVALVGAGLSVESGIPPFRGKGGLWTESRLGRDMLCFRTFMADPVAWWAQRLIDEEQTQGARAEFRMALERARPNAGHYALARMERMGVLKHLITQNVDNLHRAAGSASVAELHGNRMWLRCLDCLARFPRRDFVVDTLPPKCPRCGGLVKGDGVMFGEPIPSDVLQVCLRETNACDVMLIVGTSATVYPAAGFPRAAKERGAALVEVNIAPTPLTPMCEVSLRGPAGETLPRLVEKLQEALSNGV